jgi:hypothetical protein
MPAEIRNQRRGVGQQEAWEIGGFERGLFAAMLVDLHGPTLSGLKQGRLTE